MSEPGDRLQVHCQDGTVNVMREPLFKYPDSWIARVVADTPIDEGIVVDMEKSMFFNIYCACWPISEDYQKVSNQAPGFLRDGIITQPSAQFVRELHACDVYEYLTPEDRRTLETQCPPELLWNEGTNKMDHTPKDDDMRDSREEYEEMDDSNDEFAQLSSNESSEDGFRAVSEEDEDMVDDNEQSMADRESGVSYDSDGHPLVPLYGDCYSDYSNEVEDEDSDDESHDIDSLSSSVDESENLYKSDHCYDPLRYNSYKLRQAAARSATQRRANERKAKNKDAFIQGDTIPEEFNGLKKRFVEAKNLRVEGQDTDEESDDEDDGVRTIGILGSVRGAGDYPPGASIQPLLSQVPAELAEYIDILIVGRKKEEWLKKARANRGGLATIKNAAYLEHQSKKLAQWRASILAECRNTKQIDKQFPALHETIAMVCQVEAPDEKTMDELKRILAAEMNSKTGDEVAVNVISDDEFDDPTKIVQAPPTEEDLFGNSSDDSFISAEDDIEDDSTDAMEVEVAQLANFPVSAKRNAPHPRKDINEICKLLDKMLTINTEKRVAEWLWKKFLKHHKLDLPPKYAQLVLMANKFGSYKAKAKRPQVNIRLVGSNMENDDDFEGSQSKKRKAPIVIDLDDDDDDEPLPKPPAPKSMKVVDHSTKLVSRKTREAREREKQLQRNLSATWTLSDKAIGVFPAESGSDVFIIDALSKHLKAHQEEGAKFMWKRLVNDAGCILADTMGLGKTIQSIAVIDCFMRLPKWRQGEGRPKSYETNYTRAPLPRVLVAVPKSLLQNWNAELDRWVQKGDNIYTVLVAASTRSLKTMCEAWFETGGVLVTTHPALTSTTFVDVKEKPPSSTALTENVTQMPEGSLPPATQETESTQSTSTSHHTKKREGRAKFWDVIIRGADLAIVDEAHIMKNDDSQLFSVVSGLRTPRRVCLTGSPLQNTLREYYNMVQIINPNFLGNYDEFRKSFGDKIEAGMAVDATTEEIEEMAEHAFILHRDLQPMVLRRDISVLAKELKPKHEFIVKTGLSTIQLELFAELEKFTSKVKPAKFYEWRVRALVSSPHAFLESIKQVLNTNKKSKQRTSDQADEQDGEGEPAIDDASLEELTKLRDKAAATLADTPIDEASPKMSIILQLARRMKETNDKLLVFTNLLFTYSTIKDMLTSNKISFVGFSGEDAVTVRNEQVKQFQAPNSKVTVFLATMRTGGLGLNLTAANRVILVDCEWNPTHEMQASYRVYRIGQTRETFIYRFITEGTMETELHKCQLKKDMLFSKVIDSKDSKRSIERNTQLHIEDILRVVPAVPGRLDGLSVDKTFWPIAMEAHKASQIVSVVAKDELLRPDDEIILAEEKKQKMSTRTVQTVLEDFRNAPRRAAAEKARARISEAARAAPDDPTQPATQPVPT